MTKGEEVKGSVVDCGGIVYADIRVVTDKVDEVKDSIPGLIIRIDLLPQLRQVIERLEAMARPVVGDGKDK